LLKTERGDKDKGGERVKNGQEKIAKY